MKYVGRLLTRDLRSRNNYTILTQKITVISGGSWSCWLNILDSSIDLALIFSKRVIGIACYRRHGFHPWNSHESAFNRPRWRNKWLNK